jgi:flagellar biosynthesis anti-sigma factor FlgM
MSYTDGIANLQQALTSIATTGPKPSTSTSATGPEPSNQGVSSAVEQVDKANLSAAGGAMAQALEGSDSRAAKVAELQHAIAGGTYNVASSDVADKMIHTLLGE